MRKIILSATVAAFGIGLAAPAFAQDGPPDQAPFTGLRVEALGGYDNLQDGSDGDSEGRDGFVYGGALGYDVQVGGAVLGVEGEITGSTLKARTNNLLVAGDRLRLDAGRDLYAGVRAGYVISPRAMIYAKGGYTNARVDVRYTDGTTTIEDGAELDGFRVGAGLEYAMGPRTYIKGEYRYSNYGSAEGFDIDADRHQLMAGVGFRF